MKKDKLDRKLAEFDRLFKNYYEKPFEVQKAEDPNYKYPRD